ncbi:MAG: DUF1016 N-terminal domain-containing protein, partial [Rhodothermales bacterium]
MLQGERAEYGKQMVVTLSQPLTSDYGRGFTEKSLRRMMQFVSIFPDEAMVATLSRPLSWSHFREPAIRCLAEGDGMAVTCYERRGAGVVSVRHREARRISLLTIPCRRCRDSTNQVTFEWCFKTGKAT